jgi:prepilin-type N-terminal cleavage/methylation domain-containing protein
MMKRMKNRRGLSLIELTVALIILGVALVAVAQTVTMAARLRREIHRRRVATQEAANALERLVALPWRQLDEPALDDLELSPTGEEVLPDGKLSAEVENVAGPPVGRRIRVAVTWKNAAGETDGAVRLVGWSFHDREAKP